MLKNGRKDRDSAPRVIEVIKKKKGERSLGSLKLGGGEQRKESWRESLIRRKKAADIFWSALNEEISGSLDIMEAPPEEEESFIKMNEEAQSLYEGLGKIENGKGLPKEELKSWGEKLQDFELKANELRRKFIKIRHDALRKSVEARKSSLPLGSKDIERLSGVMFGRDARDELKAAEEGKMLEMSVYGNVFVDSFLSKTSGADYSAAKRALDSQLKAAFGVWALRDIGATGYGQLLDYLRTATGGKDMREKDGDEDKKDDGKTSEKKNEESDEEGEGGGKDRNESMELQSKYIPTKDLPEESSADEVDNELLRARGTDAERILASIGKPANQNEQDEYEKENPNLGLTKLATKMDNLGKIWKEMKVEIAIALEYNVPEQQIVARLEKFNTVLNEMVGKAVPSVKNSGSDKRTYNEIEKEAEEKRRKNFRFLALRVRQQVDVSEGEFYQAVVRKIMTHFFPLYEDRDADVNKARDEVKNFDVSEFIGHKSDRIAADGNIEDKASDVGVAGGSLEESEKAKKMEQKELELVAQGKELADAILKKKPEISLTSAKEELNSVLENSWGKVWDENPNAYRAIIAYLREIATAAGR